MGSLSEVKKYICLCGNNNMKKEHNGIQQENLDKEEKKDRLLKNKKLTLQECILNSPKSLPVPVTSSKRVHPSDVIANKDTPLLLEVHDSHTRHEDDEMETKMDDGSSTRREKTKKKVSFRMPEVAEVFILADAHKNPDVQVWKHL